jgi:5-methylcytosine-specific restriction endonuclease McrA
MIRPKAAPDRLDASPYENLRQEILRRDNWRCQSCGTMSNLEVHHKKFRSHSGDDSEDNLITMCAECHAVVHSRGANLIRRERGRRSARLASNEGIG